MQFLCKSSAEKLCDRPLERRRGRVGRHRNSNGVLPLGTLNHFAKDVNLPLELEAAVATIMTGRITHIDVGEVNRHVFLNNSSIGIYPWIVRKHPPRAAAG